MPRYDMFCKKCKFLHEVQVKLADFDKIVRCPKCKEHELERMIISPPRLMGIG